MKITKGNVVLYYCFDVASEIELKKIEMIFGKAPTESPLQLEKLGPQYVAYRVPPLHAALGMLKIKKGGKETSVKADAKIYDFGVVTLRFWFPLSGEIDTIGQRAAALVEQPEVVAAAKKEMERIVKEIKPALIRPRPVDDWEDYAVFLVNQLEKPTLASDLLSRYGNELARAAVSEPENVSESELAEVLRQPLSYYEDDLALIDWNAAFVYDPRGGLDTLDVLEHAVIELLELRTFDELLDRELDKAYDQLSAKRSLQMALAPFSGTLRHLAEVRLDTSDLIAKVENSLKLVGDVYLAKVYKAASERFHLGEWKNSVQAKLDTARDTYSMLSDEIQTARSLALEVAVVLLIILEVLLFLPH